MPNEHLDHGIEGFPEIKYGNRQIPSNVAKKQRCNTVGDPKLIYSGKIGNHLFAQKPIVCRAVILLFQIYLCKRNESFLTSTTPYLLPLAKNTLATRITFLLPKNPWYQFQSLGECCRRMFIHFPSINNLIVAVPPKKMRLLEVFTGTSFWECTASTRFNWWPSALSKLISFCQLPRRSAAEVVVIVGCIGVW